jgi:hypothetical protein
MDEKLKDAIAAARIGDKLTAQRQLTELLDEDPEQVQGWYLLSLLVDSPQKQAAYLSKTLALNPDHEKAKEQLTALQAAGTLAPTSTIREETSQPMDVLAQSDTDELPDWLREASGESEAPAVPATTPEETAVPNENLPDWLKEPAAPPDVSSTVKAVEESPTVVGKTAEPISRPDKIAADLQKTLDKPRQKQPKAVRSPKQSARNLNILLGLLVTLAVIVIILLAYLLLG